MSKEEESQTTIIIKEGKSMVNTDEGTKRSNGIDIKSTVPKTSKSMHSTCNYLTNPDAKTKPCNPNPTHSMEPTQPQTETKITLIRSLSTSSHDMACDETPTHGGKDTNKKSSSSLIHTHNLFSILSNTQTDNTLHHTYDNTKSSNVCPPPTPH